MCLYNRTRDKSQSKTQVPEEVLNTWNCLEENSPKILCEKSLRFTKWPTHTWENVRLCSRCSKNVRCPVRKTKLNVSGGGFEEMVHPYNTLKNIFDTTTFYQPRSCMVWGWLTSFFFFWGHFTPDFPLTIQNTLTNSKPIQNLFKASSNSFNECVFTAAGLF